MPNTRTVTLNFKTSDGKTLPASFSVSDGASAYEVYKAQAGNANKTEAQYLADLKGLPGNNGVSITGVEVTVKENT
ncbi:MULTISPECIES: hypothetical protein [Pectobacterium]|uniref:hypothetical protein n=1 Tax=Pectobacterium TaxID=122277 RepID=UPI001F12104B|nr:MULTISPECIES: hypothetical protein [Pectobacterium]MCE9729791.1 hypothetical protein [Pectobacterium sp. IFB5596]MCH5049361.1 hypothetical protein [Pectobacterium aquaticum]